VKCGSSAQDDVNIDKTDVVSSEKEEAILIPKEKLRVESVNGVTRKMKRNMRSLATYS
jgi:hypothetical protein